MIPYAVHFPALEHFNDDDDDCNDYDDIDDCDQFYDMAWECRQSSWSELLLLQIATYLIATYLDCHFLGYLGYLMPLNASKTLLNHWYFNVLGE